MWLFASKRKSEFGKTFDFVGKWKIWFVISAIIVAIGIGGLMKFGLNLGIDFTGGTLMEVKFEKPVVMEDVRAALTLENPIIVSSGENSFVIRAKHIDSETHDAVLEDLQAKFGAVEETRFNTIGPTVGETLKKRAFYALGIALVMIVLYIAFAFRKIPRTVSPWKFGICAIVALLHDTFIPLGIFSALGVEIDGLFITAMLTILGFSVHDTIVVFDRIRERLKTQGRDESFKEVANASLRQTMVRSLNTSLTVMITLLALLFFGSASIFYFVLALVIGITVGTYSSIFIATPLLVLWQKK